MRTSEDVPTDPDALLRYGLIASVDLAAARCTVTLDAGAESPPLPWLAPRAGDTRIWNPPGVGEQVLVCCPGGEIGAGIIVGGVFSNASPAPSDEALVLARFKDGAIFAYDPEASELLLQLPSGATTVLSSDGGIDLIGDVTVTGKLTASQDVVAAGISLKNHKHGGVAAGGAQTAAPL